MDPDMSKVFELGDVYEADFYPDQLKKKPSSFHFIVKGLQRFSYRIESLFRSSSQESLTNACNIATADSSDDENEEEYEENEYYTASRLRRNTTDTNSGSTFDSFLQDMEDDIVENRDSQEFDLYGIPIPKLQSADKEDSTTPGPQRRKKNQKSQKAPKLITIRKTVDLVINADDTIESVLQRIYDQESIIPNQSHTQCLIHEDEVLLSERMVSDYNLSRGAKLHLVLHA